MNNPWLLSKDGDLKARAMYERHYSARHYKDGRRPSLFCGPGEKIVLAHINSEYEYDAIFVWRKFISMDYQDGVNCAVFRNESALLSSMLILRAEEHAIDRWGETRLYTYVNSKKIKSVNPGYCFLCAGWNRCGETKGGLIILEKTLNPE